MGRYVFNFGRDGADGDPQDKRRLGGKGAGLAAMTQLGVPVPPGFTISTEACADRQHSDFNELGLNDEIDLALRRLEREMGLGFGDANDPLLVSVRSGAEVSMPGMMDTILNLGLNRAGVDGLARKSENPRFAWDSYRRLIQMYGSVVLGVPFERFEEALDAAKQAAGATADTDLDAAALEALVGTYDAIVEEATGRPFPDDSRAQLVGAIEAVFNSWNNPRAITYRRAHGIAGLLGTAVNVQAMVFGNMGDDCATGVCFTRDPSTGENVFFGEYLRNAQGEDVVAGIRTPRPIAELEKELPGAYGQLMGAKRTLEGHYRDLLDLEFTIQNNRLFMLQTRAGKRSGLAAFRIAAEMVASGDLDARTGVTRVEPEHVEHLLFPVFDVDAKRAAVNDGARLATGLGAGPGAASGKLAFTADAAEQLAAAGTPCILVRRETSPEDIGGMMAADGILTTTGGRTSHAAVVARGIGKCCIVGCGTASVDAKTETLRIGDKTYGPGDILSIDGFTGEVFEGALPKRESDLLRSLEAGGQVDLNTTGGHFRIVLGWADAVRRLRVRANADTPHDAASGCAARSICSSAPRNASTRCAR
ncbi:MAG: pyruvate, phosphate dikinase [Planctomycetota bacterium]|jgi:pyruvate,orthophosphate dikinase